MSGGVGFGLARGVEQKSQPNGKSGYAAATRAHAVDALDDQFRLLREECSRTRALIGELRRSPLYRVASIDPR